MSKSVGDIVGLLAPALQLSKAAGWDRVGLQIGDPTKEVSVLAVCHEITPPVVDALIAGEVDLAVTYHPLLFRPVTHLVAGNDPGGRAFRLAASGVAVAAVHTGFDVMPGGAADALAGSLDLTDPAGFGPMWGKDSVKVITFAPASAADGIATAMARAGAGTIGAYSACSYRGSGFGSFFAEPGASPAAGQPGVFNQEPEDRIEMVAPASKVDAVVAALVHAHPYEEPAYDVVATRSNAGFVGRVGKIGPGMTVADLADRVADRLGGVIRIAGSGPVSTVAAIPGSGGSLLGGIAADVVVTGDVSHHQARAAVASGMAVIDPGHAATERPGVQALYAALSDSTSNVVDMTKIDPDPWEDA